MEVISERLMKQGNNTGKGFRGLWLPIYRFLTFSLADESISRKRLIAISIEKGHVSIANGSRVLSRISIKRVKRYEIVEDRYPNAGEVVSFLTSFINETGIRRADVAVSLPKEWTVIRTANLPSSVKENLADVVSYEMDRLTPFNSDEAFYDFNLLNEDDERLYILLGAVKAEMVMPYINALKEAGFNPLAITIDLSSIGTLLRYIGEDAREFIMVRIDKDRYGYGTFIDGLMHESYINEFRGDVGDEAILSDITDLLKSARMSGKTPEVIMLVNGNDRIRQQIESATGIPVKPIDGTRFEYYGGDASIATGAIIESLWKDARQLNLLKRGVTERDKQPYILTIILLLAFIISIALYMVAPLKVEEKRLAEINRQIAEREDEIKKIEALKKEIEVVSSDLSTIEDFKKSRVSAMDVLKELTSVLPKKAWLTGMSIREDKLEIDGYAVSATELLPLLDRSGYLGKVEFSSPTVRDAAMNSDRFRIRMQIEMPEVTGGKTDAKE
ncbi:MAG: hypothetical protein Fur0020_09080 [Thermodesulfovibrionia bacterium]